MKLTRFVSPVLVLALALGSAAAAAQSEEQARVIVRFKPAADSVRAKAMALNMNRSDAATVAQTRATALGLRTGIVGSGGGLRARRSLDERTHVFVASGQSSAALAKRLAADSEVEFVAVDQRRKRVAVAAPNDPLYGTGANLPVVTGTNSSGTTVYGRTIDQWYLKTPSSTPGEVVSSIDAPTAWNVTTGSASIIVAVLDTGVRFDHPDLVGQFALNANSSNGKGGYDIIGLATSAGVATANDGNGADDDASDPGDWVNAADISGGTLGSGCDATDISNSSWHGTRVSGLIAANTNNAVGMAGVGWGIKILPVRVLGKCGGYDSDIMAGMLWAVGISVPGLPANPNVAKVLNMSLGGTGRCSGSGAGTYPGTIAQVLATGATIVAAAGNSEGQAVGVPGNCPGVIAVAALRHVGSKVGFSSVGSEVSIAAPGGNCINIGTGEPCLYPMVSSTNSGKTTPVPNDPAYTGSTASVGTSFSAPIVSGTVALMLSARPSLTSTEVLALLKRTARPFVTTGGTAGTAQCVAPTAVAQDECYCTTSTCGAGMLDAGAAVALAQAANTGESVVIAATPAAAIAGQTITVSVAGSTVGTGRTIASVAWTLTSGGAGAAFSSAASGTSTTLSTSAAGTFIVKAALTDDLGIVHSNTATVTIAAAPVVTPPATTSSGGGGGAFSASWLMGLALASWALRVKKPRQRRRA